MQTWKQEEYREIRIAISVDEVMNWKQNTLSSNLENFIEKEILNVVPFKDSNSMWLSLILISDYEKREADIFLQLWQY